MISKADILETLNEWNYWNRDLPLAVERKSYEEQVLAKSETGEIIILKGVRRSGKSTILLNTIRNRISKGVNPNDILFINLEDPRFISDLDVKLLAQIREVYLEYLNPTGLPYFFLDEIQNVPHFEKWVLKEYELRRSRLFLTGSNARLLSREIGTALTGRYLEVNVFPLGFQEFLAFKGIHVQNQLDRAHYRLEINRSFQEYLTFGGFPKIALIEDPEIKKAELKTYFDSILLRDIVARYRLDNVEALMTLSVYLLSNISNLLSVNTLKNYFKLSFDLIGRYVEYLENAYLIFRVPLFDWSFKRQQVNPKKIYAIDIGLANLVSFQVGQKLGARLENLVFLELLRRGKEIFYYKTSGNLEVDFVIKEKDKIVEMIQVSAGIDEEKTKLREIRSLIKAKNEIPYTQDAKLTLLVPDINEILLKNGEEVHITDLKSWLLF